MSEQVEAAMKLLARCMQLRNEGRGEAVLRAEFASHLRVIFTDREDASWVNHYTEGSEAGTKIGQAMGPLRHRFIDNLVRSTVIEYEPDLRIEARRKQGYSQVKE